MKDKSDAGKTFKDCESRRHFDMSPEFFSRTVILLPCVVQESKTAQLFAARMQRNNQRKNRVLLFTARKKDYLKVVNLKILREKPVLER